MDDVVIWRWFGDDTDPTAVNMAVGVHDNALVIRLWNSAGQNLAFSMRGSQVRELMERIAELTTDERDTFP